MYMLHKMSEVRGWTHNEMMGMSKRVFFRYYGYWYADQFNETMFQEFEQNKAEANRKLNKL